MKKIILIGFILALFAPNASAEEYVECVRVSQLHTFPNPYDDTNPNPFHAAEGGHPFSPVIVGSDGMLYGTTPYNGPNQAGDENYSCSSGHWINNPESKDYHPEYKERFCPGTVYRLSKSGANFEVLYAFDSMDVNYNNLTGYRPMSGVIESVDGYIYGTAMRGGTNDTDTQGAGVIFKLDPSDPDPPSTFERVYDFGSETSWLDGSYPYSTLIDDGSGILYGATKGGGTGHKGTLFSFDIVSESLSTIFDLDTNDGILPFGSPIIDNDYLYGITNYGGAYSDGTIYSYDLIYEDYTVIADKTHDSTGLNTDQPSSQHMMIASDGNYYGTVQFGGDYETGYVFKLTPSENFTIIHSFGDISSSSSPPYSNSYNGAQPMSTLVEGADGFLYGTTYYGGRNGTGTLFQLKKDGSSFIVLYSFPIKNISSQPGCHPHAGIVRSGSYFYGTTAHCGSDGAGNSGFGTVFKMEPPLSFKAIQQAELNTLYESDPIRVSCLKSSTVGIVNGEYKINDGQWTTSQSSIATGDIIRVRITSSSNYNTRVLATVFFYGTGNSSFKVTTKQQP